MFELGVACARYRTVAVCFGIRTILATAATGRKPAENTRGRRGDDLENHRYSLNM